MAKEVMLATALESLRVATEALKRITDDCQRTQVKVEAIGVQLAVAKDDADGVIPPVTLN